MVPMHARRRKEAFHEPTHPRPDPGGERAFVRVLSVPLLGGVRGGFTVPMHGIKVVEAFHESRKVLGQFLVAYATRNCPIAFLFLMQAENERVLSINYRRRLQVLDCASPLALWQWRRANRKRQRTGAVQDATARSRGSWSQCMRKTERGLSMNRPVTAPGLQDVGRVP